MIAHGLPYRTEPAAFISSLDLVPLELNIMGKIAGGLRLSQCIVWLLLESTMPLKNVLPGQQSRSITHVPLHISSYSHRDTRVADQGLREARTALRSSCNLPFPPGIFYSMSLPEQSGILANQCPPQPKPHQAETWGFSRQPLLEVPFKIPVPSAWISLQCHLGG